MPLDMQDCFRNDSPVELNIKIFLYMFFKMSDGAWYFTNNNLIPTLRLTFLENDDYPIFNLEFGNVRVESDSFEDSAPMHGVPSEFKI